MKSYHFFKTFHIYRTKNATIREDRGVHFYRFPGIRKTYHIDHILDMI